MSAPRFRSTVLVASVALAATLGAGCLVDGDADTASVRVALDLGSLGLSAEELWGPREADGLLHLDAVPACVHLEVSGPGLDPPVVAGWPDRGALTPRAVVELTIDVPVGLQRRFAFVAYVYDRRAGELRTWNDDGTIVRDLTEGGVESDLAVTLHETGRGTIAGTLDGAGADDVVEVLAVDGDPAAGAIHGPGVALPAATVESGAFEIVDAPVGRALTFVLVRSDGTTLRSTTAAVELTTDGQRLEPVVRVP
ncbi:MAG: hypothetical protein JXB32_14725 [Deltaproteobacteria bacterium]|nr:hypothetical protein [Deltaproteobacteria bacterium]